MSKVVRFLALPALVLVLSLAIMSTGAFAQGVEQSTIHGALPAAAMLPANTSRAQDGPSPIDTGFGGGGIGRFGGFGGFGGWNNHICINHRCGPVARSIRRCVRGSRTDRSFWTIRRQSFQNCRWIKAERW